MNQNTNTKPEIVINEISDFDDLDDEKDTPPKELTTSIGGEKHNTPKNPLTR